MLAAMFPLHAMAIAILIALFLLWNLDFIATMLNLKALGRPLPEELRRMYDDERLQKTKDYLGARAKSDVIESTVSLTLLLGFWLAGGFPWLDDLARGWFPASPVAAGTVFLAVLLGGQYLLSLPLQIHDTFGTEARFGFNRTTPALFVADQLKGLALAAILGLPLAAGVIWIFLRVPHAWLIAWAVVTAFQILMTYLAPALIMPLFNRFEPMPEGELKTAIEDLATRCEFPLAEVCLMDGSKRSTKANAFFTGFGKHKKIALFDTLVEKHSVEELVAVLAHEIGHFKLRHITQRLAVSLVQSAALFFLLGIATDPHGSFARLLFDAFGVKQISPHVGLVLFGILFSPVSRLLGVFSHAWSRRHEFQADAYARESVGSPAPLCSALQKLSTDQLAHPAPHSLRVWLDYSHPPLLDRLRALNGSRA
jgi:STE24 endopeptidase